MRRLNRVLVVALVGATIGWWLRSRGGSGRSSTEPPVIGGDTWPPVPVNPARIS